MSGMLIRCVFIAAWLMMAGSAHAHSGLGPNGGRVAEAGKYHLELVVKKDELRVFITADADAKVETKGAQGNATVLAGKERSSLKLAPAGSNALAAPGKFDPQARMTVVVSVTLPNQAPIQARFAP